MVELIWSEPALQDLDAMADYIALDKPDAARALVARVFDKVELQVVDMASPPIRESRSRD